MNYQDRASEMYERHKDEIQDKLEDTVDHLSDVADLLNRIDDEELVDEINYHISKILGNIDEI